MTLILVYDDKESKITDADTQLVTSWQKVINVFRTQET